MGFDCGRICIIACYKASRSWQIGLLKIQKNVKVLRLFFFLYFLIASQQPTDFFSIKTPSKRNPYWFHFCICIFYLLIMKNSLIFYFYVYFFLSRTNCNVFILPKNNLASSSFLNKMSSIFHICEKIFVQNFSVILLIPRCWQMHFG